jgi:hypothetical protein
MSKFGCTCGHIIYNQTDSLPYKARIQADEDMEKPIELLAGTLSHYMEARQQGQGAEFMRQFKRSKGWTESGADCQVQELAGKPVSATLFELIFDFWTDYVRVVYECEACGRLWVEMDHNHFVAYLPETDTRHVLWSRRNHNP